MFFTVEELAPAKNVCLRGELLFDYEELLFVYEEAPVCLRGTLFVYEPGAVFFVLVSFSNFLALEW